MQLKMLVVMVDAAHTEAVMDGARGAGASGATLIHQARGQGRRGLEQFIGLSLDGSRDVLLFIVSARRAAPVAECIARLAQFDETPGTGIVFQLDVEDSIGIEGQIRSVEQAGPLPLEEA
jgi:nitrogen regulatory protein PII